MSCLSSRPYELIEREPGQLSIRQQCKILGVNRSTLYYQAKELDQETQLLMRLADEEFTRHPFYGTRRMREYLRKLGHIVGRKRVQRLYELLGLEAVYPKPKLSKGCQEHVIYPYLLKDVEIARVNQVWSTDITYSVPGVQHKHGCLKLNHKSI